MSSREGDVRRTTLWTLFGRRARLVDRRSVSPVGEPRVMPGNLPPWLSGITSVQAVTR